MILLIERTQLLEHYTFNGLLHVSAVLTTIGQILQHAWEKIPRWWPPMHS